MNKKKTKKMKKGSNGLKKHEKIIINNAQIMQLSYYLKMRDYKSGMNKKK